MAIPPLDDSGELPLGVHTATLREVLARFGVGSAQRIAVGLRLERIHAIARATCHLGRFVVFGSFVTDKAEPNDVDLFFIMENSFDPALLTGEVQRLFDHLRRKPISAPACSGFADLPVWKASKPQ